MKEYTHFVINKANEDLNSLRNAVVADGLKPLQDQEGFDLTKICNGYKVCKHYEYVFMWDDSAKGLNNVAHFQGLVEKGSAFRVRIRWKKLTESGLIFSGTLKGDNKDPKKPPSGKSTNGAWAFKGRIAKNYLFIDGADNAEEQGYQNWFNFKGWDGNG